jgi:hypothetical protein
MTTSCAVGDDLRPDTDLSWDGVGPSSGTRVSVRPLAPSLTENRSEPGHRTSARGLTSACPGLPRPRSRRGPDRTRHGGAPIGQLEWTVALWLNEPSGWLDGKKPIRLIATEPDRIVRAARKATEPIRF